MWFQKPCNTLYHLDSNARLTTTTNELVHEKGFWHKESFDTFFGLSKTRSHDGNNEILKALKIGIDPPH